MTSIGTGHALLHALIIVLLVSGAVLLSAAIGAQTERPKGDVAPQVTPTPTASPTRLIYGISLAGEPPGSPNNLFSFDAATPGTLRQNTPLAGLKPMDRLVAIDFRPATGELYGVSSQSRLYRVHGPTATAAVVNTVPFTPSLPAFGASFGCDFDPVTDRLRVISSQGLNIELDPNTGMVTQVGTPLAFAAGDPNAGRTPVPVGLAYSNPVGLGSTAYVVDSGADILARLGSPAGTPTPPSSGQLTTIGGLGVDTFEAVGLDIAPDGIAWASLSVPGGGSSFKLYRIDLTGGAATLVGEIGIFTVADIAAQVDTVAANGTLAGRVVTAGGHGIRNARLTLTGGPITEPLIAATGSFGDYRFDHLPLGQTYTITVTAARHTFTTPTRTVTFNTSITDANFTAEGP